MDDNSRIGKPSGLRRKASLNVTFCVKKEKSSNYKKIYSILQKSESDRTAEENETLENSATVVKEVASRLEKRRRLKSRSEEIEDQPNVLAEKCRLLAGALLNAQHLVVYSGAGVSTAARIPDYRGTNGIWTRLQQGKDIGCHDLSQAEPTLTHMALFALYRCGKLKHIVSQNCDGLHLRSGVPRSALSEVHGNMYLEVCTPCKLEYWRLFDVTEHTGRYAHETARLCFYCRKPLRDTIVHFGERGALKWPLNWKGACDNADKADIILCIGSSLKVLKRYPWLWCMDKPVKKRPMLFIVNLQWTPKDDQATLKINGKCDEVMSLVMSHLGMAVPKYIRHLDPIFAHATVLHEVELHTTSQPILQLIVKQSKVEPEEEKLSLTENNDNSIKNSDIKRSASILIKDEIDDNIDDLKLDFVEEEVIITTTIEEVDENDHEIIECVKMEIDDNESDIIVDADDSAQIIKSESFSNNDKNGDVDDKFLIKQNDGDDDNHNFNDKVKVCNSELWRPFNDSSLNKNDVCNKFGSNSDKTDANEAACSKSNTNGNSSCKINSKSISVGNNLLNSGHNYSLKMLPNNTSIDNKSKIFLIDDIVTAGFSVPLEEFDKMYCKIGKELAKKNSGEFFQEFCSNSNDDKGKSLSVTTVTTITCSANNSNKYDVKNVSCNINDINNSDDKLKNRSTKISQGILSIDKKSNNNVINNKNNNSYCDKNKKNDKFDSNTLIQTQPLDLSLVKSSRKDDVKFNNSRFNCPKSSSSCQFCSGNYGSRMCQFYNQLIPVIPDTGPFCYCCDDDESDNENPTEKSDLSSDKNAADKKPAESSTNKVPIINPGWFGKGYRKRTKKKR